MADKEYICLSSDKGLCECELHSCPKCGEKSCPQCGGEVSTIQEYEEAQKANAD